jgi:hypothetical protein
VKNSNIRPSTNDRIICGGGSAKDTRLNKVFFEGDHVQGVEYPTD